LLPDGIAIADAPADDPSRPLNQDDLVAGLRRKDVEVIETPTARLP
jgi:hypothetical protein